MHEEIVSHLVAAGLTRNESLAYVSLLESDEDGGMTGYEVAARSGIPRSAVYSVLRKLENTGAAFSTGDKPARYVPTPPERFVTGLRSESNSTYDKLDTALKRIPIRALPEPIWTLSRYEQVLARLDQMLRSAEQSIYLSLWSRELDALRPALESVADRGLHQVVHSVDAVTDCPPGFSCWTDSVTDDADKATWSHKILAVVDRKTALMGGADPDADNHAVVTTNPSLVDVATNHIILDITLLARAQGRDPAADVAPMMRPHLAAEE
ncbi:MAG: TrmB family transcriptional regulator [Deltaproteobacteria bacterium]|nr:TrmB family transcriptional regulator [Deltaproteobacteria bacterium]